MIVFEIRLLLFILPGRGLEILLVGCRELKLLLRSRSGGSELNLILEQLDQFLIGLFELEIQSGEFLF